MPDGSLIKELFHVVPQTQMKALLTDITNYQWDTSARDCDSEQCCNPEIMTCWAAWHISLQARWVQIHTRGSGSPSADTLVKLKGEKCITKGEVAQITLKNK